MTLTTVYDAASQVLAMVYSHPARGAVQSFTYTYDSRGNRKTKVFADGSSETYGYDDLSRLTSADYSATGRQVDYVYDAVGNRQTMVEVTGSTTQTTTYAYNEFNQLTSLTKSNETTSFVYDDNGNQTHKHEPNNVTTTFVYDARDRMTQVVLPGGATNTFGYDTQGLRVYMNDSGGQRRVLLDGIEEYAEYDATTLDRTARYDHDPSRIDALLAQVTSQGTHYFVTDALGSVYGVTDAIGLDRARYDYDVYGARTATLEQVATRWGFTGRPDHADRTLYYRARQYDSDLGRFSQPDPWRQFGGPNRYLYADASPTVARDPMGLMPWLDEESCRYSNVNITLAKTAVITAFAAARTDLMWSGFMYLPGGGGGALSARYFSYAASGAVDVILAAPIKVECECDSDSPHGGTEPPDADIPYWVVYFNASKQQIWEGAILHEFVHVGMYYLPEAETSASVWTNSVGPDRKIGMKGAVADGVYTDTLEEVAAYMSGPITRITNPLNLYFEP
jgi:RHS repeat-associated protein